MAGVTYWSRRDTADRALLGQAAYDVCKALRSSDGVDDARFYWAGPDTIVVHVSAQDPAVLFGPPNDDAARAFFALADMAVRDRFEQWLDPRTGMQQYQMAGR